MQSKTKIKLYKIEIMNVLERPIVDFVDSNYFI